MANIVVTGTAGSAVRVTDLESKRQIITAPDPVSVRNAMMELGAPIEQEDDK